MTRLLVAVLIALSCSCTRLSDLISGDRSASNGTAQKIIDVHTHTSFDNNFEPSSGIIDSAATYRATWKRANVVGAISHLKSGSTATPELADMPVIFCVGIGDDVDVDGVEKLLQQPEYGCIKIYLGYVHRFAYDADYRPLYTLAAKYNVPVVFHTGDTYTSTAKLKFADPLTIDEVAVDFPETRFLIAHLGNPWIQSAAEVAYKNPNVYVEASALIIGPIGTLSIDWRDDYGSTPVKWAWGYLENPEKLLFGSDWPLVDIEAYADIYKRAIPKEHWPAVFHDNALKVFPKLAER